MLMAIWHNWRKSDIFIGKPPSFVNITEGENLPFVQETNHLPCDPNYSTLFSLRTLYYFFACVTSKNMQEQEYTSSRISV